MRICSESKDLDKSDGVGRRFHPPEVRVEAYGHNLRRDKLAVPEEQVLDGREKRREKESKLKEPKEPYKHLDRQG